MIVQKEKKEDKNKEKVNKEIIKEDFKLKKQRSKFWDIAKGIGIISVVIGHTGYSNSLTRFVYTYHLVIFYFVSAYFYNEKKYGDVPYINFAHKLKNNYGKYMFYSIIIILLHNFFCKYNFYTSKVTPNSFVDTIATILNSMVFINKEGFTGTMWFVPTLIFALSLFGIIIYLSRKLSKKISNIAKYNEKEETQIKYLSIILLSVLTETLGVYLIEKSVNLQYHLQTSFVVIPICTFAYFLRIYTHKLEKFDNIYANASILLISGGILWYCVNIKGFQIELYYNKIINFYMFLIISMIGIVFCLSMAKIIEKITICNSIMSSIGKSSFAVMVLHCVFIKLLDLVYAYKIGETNFDWVNSRIAVYPDKLFILYILCGVCFPTLFSVICQKIQKSYKCKEM